MRQLVSIAGVVPDRWVHLSELAGREAPVTHLIVPWAEWQKSAADWRQRAPNVGVSVTADTAFAALLPQLDRLTLIAIGFPSISEGRGYSLARQLRERGHYTGELRASGEIFRDHMLFLARCGFDTFEISRRETPQEAFAALKSFTVAYQPVRTEPAAIALARRRIQPLN
jgi:uncharacterized protein (DUF934 family)